MADAQHLYMCPYCEGLFTLNDPSHTWHNCPHCAGKVNSDVQDAYLRARARYEVAADSGVTIYAPKYRTRDQLSSKEKGVLRIYEQAYTGLQVAFRAELPDDQRRSAIEMMAEMTPLFEMRHMISALEAQYWGKLMVEQTAQEEYERLKAKMERHKTDLLGAIRRLRWHLRRHHLERALQELDEEIHRLEEQIAFVNYLRVRG